MQGDPDSNIRVYHLGQRRHRKGDQSDRNKSRSKSRGGVHDVENEFETDEDKLVASLQRKRADKAKFVEGVRERQARMTDLNDQIRKYDLKQVKDEELAGLNAQIGGIHNSWDELKKTLEQKLKFCE